MKESKPAAETYSLLIQCFLGSFTRNPKVSQDIVKGSAKNDGTCTYKFWNSATDRKYRGNSCRHLEMSVQSPCATLCLRTRWPVKVFICRSSSGCCGPGTVVGITTFYGLDGPGIESRWEATFSAPLQTGPAAHPASCTIGTGSFTGVKSGRGVTQTPHPLLVPWSRKSRAIPLLPLETVRPVQSVSACTGVHFTCRMLNYKSICRVHQYWRRGLKYMHLPQQVRYLWSTDRSVAMSTGHRCIRISL